MMKDYEALSRKHFHRQAVASSGDCHTTNRRGIARMMEKAGFTVAESRQVQGLIYTVTGRKGKSEKTGLFPFGKV